MTKRFVTDPKTGLMLPRFSLPSRGQIDAVKARLSGLYKVQHIRNGEIIDEEEVSNIIVNQGLDHILGVEFTGVTQITQWYLAPFANNYTPVASDTAATIVSNSGESTAYSASTRVAFTPVEASQQATNSASVAAFSFTASATIYGAFLISSSSKSSTSGVLFSATPFSTSKSVSSGDSLNLTYTVQAASS